MTSSKKQYKLVFLILLYSVELLSFNFTGRFLFLVAMRISEEDTYSVTSLKRQISNGSVCLITALVQHMCACGLLPPILLSGSTQKTQVLGTFHSIYPYNPKILIVAALINGIMFSMPLLFPCFLSGLCLVIGTNEQLGKIFSCHSKRRFKNHREKWENGMSEKLTDGSR